MGQLKAMVVLGALALHGAGTAGPHHTPRSHAVVYGVGHAGAATSADLGRGGLRYAGPDVPMLSRDDRAPRRQRVDWTQDRAMT